MNPTSSLNRRSGVNSARCRQPLATKCLSTCSLACNTSISAAEHPALRPSAASSVHASRSVAPRCFFSTSYSRPLDRLHPSPATPSASASTSTVPDGSVSVVLLAGGVGKRMGASIPKQYLKLRGREIATYSLETFSKMREVSEIIIVCDPSWRDVFERCIATLPKHIIFKWALPGAERQDSVFNGLQEVRAAAGLVAVHDSARPLVTAADASRCFCDAQAIGAAVLGAPVKPTIKEVDKELNVVKTLQRSVLWEVQTPQVIRPATLQQGFALVRSKGLEVTDDVSIIEAMGLPVRITPGAYTNIKVTTPDDLSIAEKFLDVAEVGVGALV